jgi:hypothetical protein
MLPAPGFHVFLSWTVADLAACIFQIRGLFRAYETARPVVAGGVAGIAFPDLFFAKPFFYALNALERPAFFGILYETVIFLRMADFALFRADIRGGAALDNCVAQAWFKHVQGKHAAEYREKKICPGRLQVPDHSVRLLKKG